MEQREPSPSSTEPGAEEPPAGPPARAPGRWLALVTAVSLLSLYDGLSLTRVFYVRDMSFFYWPAHRWARRALLSGELPLWDPYPAFGQPAVADAARHLFFPPALVARLLLPEALGFNMSVLLAFPTAAAGAFLLFRRRVSDAAAALGALLFALSGPVLSTGQFTNHAWTLALAPWALWAAERIAAGDRRRGVAAMAAATALQALAGEPVTLAVTVGLAAAYAALGAPAGGWRRRAAPPAIAIGGALVGFFLAAIQTFPLLDAVTRSTRGAIGGGQALPVHPLSLAETVAWPLFDNPFNSWDFAAPWLRALNEVDPYLFSLYVGAGALALAAAGYAASWREPRAIFWAAVLVVAVICSLGEHTPVYPLLRRAVPALELFRYPSKYFCFAALALAALAALGWDAYRDGRMARRALAAGAGTAAAAAAAAALAWAGTALLPEATAGALEALARAVGAEGPETAAAILAESLAGAAPRLLLVAAAAGVLLAVGGARPQASAVVRGALFAVVVVDPLATNSAINPTLDARLLGDPAWAEPTRERPEARVFMPGRIDFYFGEGREEGLGEVSPRLRRATNQQVSAIVNARFPAFPAAPRLREAISMDLTSVWPVDYARLVVRYAASPGEDRLRLLTRTGVRYFVLAAPPPGGAPRLPVEDFDLTLFEREGARPRAELVAASRVEPDRRAQIDALFRAGFDPSAELLLDAEAPAPAGEPAPPSPPGAAIVEEGAGEVRVLASAPEGGAYLLLWDSYDPHWRAEVDGREAALVRANGLFRAVRLAPGAHDVRFVYRPTPFYAGCAVSLATLLALAWLRFAGARRAA